MKTREHVPHLLPPFSLSPDMHLVVRFPDTAFPLGGALRCPIVSPLLTHQWHRTGGTVRARTIRCSSCSHLYIAPAVGILRVGEYPVLVIAPEPHSICPSPTVTFSSCRCSSRHGVECKKVREWDRRRGGRGEGCLKRWRDWKVAVGEKKDKAEPALLGGRKRPKYNHKTVPLFGVRQKTETNAHLKDLPKPSGPAQLSSLICHHLLPRIYRTDTSIPFSFTWLLPYKITHISFHNVHPLIFKSTRNDK